MFRRVATIRKFGVFNNFTGGNLPEFASFNLIYGWNYSGKTTLSRLFRCIETGSLHPNYPDAHFSFSHQDGNNYEHDFKQPCCVRVFNEDFRQENLRWDEAEGFNPVLLLGVEQIDARNILQSKEAERGKHSNDLAASLTEAKRLKDIVAKAETECAGQIVRELPVGRFDKRNLKSVIEAWDGALPEPLTDAEFSEARAKISSEEKETLPDLVVDTSPIENIWREAVALLGERLNTSTTIARFIEHPHIGSWVEQGLALHDSGSRCEFCNGPLLSDRMAALAAHFSKAFDELKNRIGINVEALSARKLKLSGEAYTRAAFYPDLQAEQVEAGKELAHVRDALNSALQELIDKLERKKSNPFDIVPPPTDMPNFDTLIVAISRFSSLIATNNQRTQLFSSARSGAVIVLKNHYAAEAMRRIDRFALLAEIDGHEKSAQRASDKIVDLDRDILSLRAELSNASKGAEAINDALFRFFGKNDLHVSVKDDDKFILMRGSELARNLSEGERTAIAFCYFVTKLLEQGNDLSQTIVYIDDPISSLDAHHLLHINAFIKSTFYKFDREANPKHICLAKQLFISTHNYEFFHLTWDWMTSTKNVQAAAYLVERTDANGLVSSRIVECPESISRYKSEYLFLYHQLANYLEAPSNDPQVIFNLGNMARRFFEGYLSFKFFEHHKIDNTISRVIADPVECERARKFMHFYSHTLNRAGGIRLPDMSEAVSVVNLILDAVRSHDPIHYGSLEETRMQSLRRAG